MRSDRWTQRHVARRTPLTCHDTTDRALATRPQEVQGMDRFEALAVLLWFHRAVWT
jgi:hypothetical protein